jgi:sugar phosphate isomerase/epimerase
MTNRILDNVSYHAVYDLSIPDALNYARANGFAGIQLAVEMPHLSFESVSSKEAEKIRSVVESDGTRITIHGPDEVASLFEYSPIFQQGILNYYRALFDFAASVKSPLVTLHMGAAAAFRTDTIPVMDMPKVDRALYKERAEDNLDKLAGLAAGRFIICVENHNLDEFSLSILRPYLESRKLALCWDLAKSWDRPDIEKFFFDHIQNVKQVHLHDLQRNKKGEMRRHYVIGTGIIDFRYYLDRLAKADVLDYCIEVRPREKAKESLEALKKLLNHLPG